jgi:predicted transcriptional regulator
MTDREFDEMAPVRIEYGNQLAALATAERVLRFVSAIALVAREMQRQPAAEPYEAELARYYARWVLMPNREFRWLADELGDADLAEYFDVPLEEVAEKRIDLALMHPDPLGARMGDPAEP